MASDSQLFIGFLVVVLLGFVYNQIWLSFVIGAVLFLMLFLQEEPVKKSSSSSVIVRPIKVQRKYEEGASIYPKKMEIHLAERGPPKAWERGPEPIGKAVGKGLKWLFNHF